MVGKVTCIITHYKGRLVDKCVKSLRHTGINIIIASSQRRTLKGTKWLHVRKNEPTFKHNYASIYVRTPYLMFVDDDVEIFRDCVRQMEVYLDLHPETAMVYATLYRYGNRKIVDTAGSWLTYTGFLLENYIVPPRPINILAAKTACCMVRKSVFEKVGKFDNDFVLYCDETDLSWRIWHAGYNIKLLPKAKAYHKLGGEKDESYYNQRYIHYHGCKNYISMLIKNLNKRWLWIAFVNACIWFGVGVLFLFKNRKVSKWIFEGIWYNIRNFKHIWKKRQRIKHTKSERCLMAKVGWKYYVGRLRDYLTNQLHKKV